MDPKIKKMEPWSAKGSQKRSWPEPGGRTGRHGGPVTRVKGLKDHRPIRDHTRQRAEGPANLKPTIPRALKIKQPRPESNQSRTRR